ncbi:cyclic nucleotide-binding domain-containing protein [Scytonema sp. NUACC26]|uniref:cyclic nucleotide-binding domain-containing protein n=1 Tax=Scytonema sp. NUACC26 TaxID=3140176 RepID=UPI0034DC2568
MAKVLLNSLSSSDIDWMVSAGTRKHIPPNTVLIRQGEPLHGLYILLDGSIAVTVSQPSDNPLGHAFAVLEGGKMSGREIARLDSGEMIGEMPLLETSLSSTTIKTVTKSLVLSIPQHRLLGKLQEDESFAAHLYRAIAILLANRLEKIISQLGNNSTIALCEPQIREILFVFGELSDLDIDWMVSVGTPQNLSAGTVLIHAGKAIDALHILLDGKMTVSISEDKNDFLARAFSSLEDSESESSEQEFAWVLKGDIVGETPFVEVPLPFVTVRAVENSVVLSIPQWRLAAKLMHDIGFAARFYKVLAILLADKQQQIISQFSYGRLRYSKEQPLDENSIYENELSSHFLAQMTLAGNRFDWMLKKIIRS